MTTNYWPWWLGGSLLAGIAVAFPLLTGIPLGVSGFLARLVRGTAQVKPGGSGCGPDLPPVALSGDCGTPSPSAASGALAADGIPRVLFLVGMAIGGGLAGWAGGQSWKTSGLSPEFFKLYGGGISAVLVLFLGGILVGFGTRLSGGCTSGHGLSGCGRLQPASLIATAVFFGVAIVVSFLIERLLS